MKLPEIDWGVCDIDTIIFATTVMGFEIAQKYQIVPVEIPNRTYLLLITAVGLTEQEYCELRFIIRRELVLSKVDCHILKILMTKAWPDIGEKQFSSKKTDEFKARLIVETRDKDSDPSKIISSIQNKDSPDVSIIEIVDDIFSKAVQVRASDIHIEPVENEVKVRFRLDGVLQQILAIPKSRQNEIISRLKILARMDIAEKRRPQDGRIIIEGKNKIIDVRVSTMPTASGEKIVLRLLDKSSQPLDLEAIGLCGTNYEVFCHSIRKPSGMILVTGPTGSGKTTTLYAALKEIYSSNINISTVEDPIEYRIAGINQTQFNPDIDYTFATAVKTFLRQDPDVIMIGEIRDPETAKYAIQASQTGHLVFSTLHTNDAPGAVVRLLEMGMEPYLVASTLQLVIAQRLLRVSCRSCGEFRDLTDREELYARRNKFTVNHVFGGKGCRECLYTGYKGRIGIYEIMLVTSELQDMIALKTPTQKIREMAIMQGMSTLHQEALSLVSGGKTTLEEVESSIG